VKLAVSNLAWDPEEEAEVAAKLTSLGVSRVEIAPTKRWSDPTKASRSEVSAYRKWWEDRGFKIVALQSLVFGRPDLTIFDDEASRQKFLDYLRQIVDLGAYLGAGVLVFGSPKNRLRGELSVPKANDVAVSFFRQVGDYAHKAGVTFCIEPNAPQYGCDFVTTAAEGSELVARVASPGFGLHLDAACMTLAGDDPASVGAYSPRHFHISAPYLSALDPAQVDYEKFADSLRKSDYQNVVSIEMKPDSPGNIERTVAAIRLAQQVFSG